MAVKATGIVKQLGWRGFFQLITHLPSFLKLFSRLIKDARVPLTSKLLLVGILAYVDRPRTTAAAEAARRFMLCFPFRIAHEAPVEGFFRANEVVVVKG